MNKLITLAALTSTLLASALTHAATTTELKVTGVIRPAACTPSFTGGGTVDYGVIPPTSLSATAPTVLAEKSVPFSVTCDAATKVAVRAIDNRSASVAPGVLAAAGAGFVDNYAYGLGTVGGKKVGAYKIRMPQGSFTADGTTPDLIYDLLNDNTWKRSGGGNLYSNGTGRLSFATAGTIVPSAYKTMTGTIAVQAVIDKTSNLDLTGDVPLDGSATIEVQYL
ncbi:DUF1120 domain-containing protein [Herbaspirillum rhizosphaerae]|uniref:DUF1120 domain-containing protein n=1 Tax=Herbaspirillum rhizosphaerae TaxID=346179 RepID=UPI00067D7D58|nr:DUF1120 domain-containing protein [Herbaspirillum rhizosphaerae]